MMLKWISWRSRAVLRQSYKSMEKCRRMKRPQFTSKNWIFLDYECPRKDVSSDVAWKALRWKRIFFWMGQRSKNHISLKAGFEYNATQRTSFLSSFQTCQRVLPPILILQLQWHLRDRRDIVLHLLQARLLLQRQLHQVTVRLEKERIELKVIPLQCLCQV